MSEVMVKICESGACLNPALPGRSYCRICAAAPADELTKYDRAELDALRDLHEGSRDRRKRSVFKAAAAVSFAVAGSAAALALGAGALGVAFVAGCAGGIYSLVRASE